MSDFEAPIKQSIVDATDPTKAVAVTAANELKVKQAALTAATDAVTATLASGSTVAISGTPAVTVSGQVDTRPLAVATDKVEATLAAGSTVAISGTPSVTVTGSVDTRPLTAATDTVTATLAAGAVVSIASSQVPVLGYGEGTSVAKGSSITTDLVVGSGKKFKGHSLLIGSAGKVKVQFGTYDGTTFTVKGTVYQQPASTVPVAIPGLSITGNGTIAIRVVTTNMDNATDLHATIQGTEE